MRKSRTRSRVHAKVTLPITRKTEVRQKYESGLVVPRLYSTESVKGRKI